MYIIEHWPITLLIAAMVIGGTVGTIGLLRLRKTTRITRGLVKLSYIVSAWGALVFLVGLTESGLTIRDGKFRLSMNLLEGGVLFWLGWVVRHLYRAQGRQDEDARHDSAGRSSA